jgi:hypothetical protein
MGGVGKTSLALKLDRTKVAEFGHHALRRACNHRRQHRVAQFIYLLLHNEKIRDVIDIGKRARSCWAASLKAGCIRLKAGELHPVYSDSHVAREQHDEVSRVLDGLHKAPKSVEWSFCAARTRLCPAYSRPTSIKTLSASGTRKNAETASLPLWKDVRTR